MPRRSALLTVTAATLGCTLALGASPPAGAAPGGTPGDTAPLSVTFPEAGGRVSGGDLTFRGSVSNGDLEEDQRTLVQYVVDVSGSTAGPLQDCNGDGTRDALDDFNGDGRLGDVLDCEISAVVALNAGLRATAGAPESIRVGLTAFGSSAASAQMKPDEPMALFVNPGLTGDGVDVIPNANVVASSLRPGYVGEYAEHFVGTNTSFDAALGAALTALDSHPGPRWIFLLSDGDSTVTRATLDRVTASGAHVRTFAVGTGTGSDPCAAGRPLGQIATAGGDGCVQVLDPAGLTASVAGTQPAWIRSVTVEVDGRTVEAEIDPIGGWTATVPDLPIGSHTAVVTATFADDTTWTEVVPFRVSNGLSYVALGDSYASGEGVAPYLSGSADDQLCHRSRTGWPTLISPDDGESLSTREDAVFTFVACSGARIVNLDTTEQPKSLFLQPGGAIPLQIDQLRPDADLVTLSLGGNDLGFAPIVTHCVLSISCPEKGFITTSSGSDVNLEDWTKVRLALIGNELTGAYTAIRDRVSPETTIVATTYPRLVSPDLVPSDLVNLTCSPFALSAGERQWLRRQIDTFAAVVSDRARRPGADVRVVDVRDDFEDHNVCDSGAYITGPTILRLEDLDVGLLSAASFHPDTRGANLYAAAVNDALRDLDRPGARADNLAPVVPSDNPVVTDPDAVLEQYPPDVVGAVGSTSFAEVALGNGAGFDGLPSCEHVVSGEVVPLLAQGFAPDSEVTATTVTLGHGDGEGVELGRATSTHRTDAGGDLLSAIVAPEVDENGLLTVSLRGTNTSGGPAIGSVIASTSTDPACRATVERAGRIDPGAVGVGPTPTPSPAPDVVAAPESDTQDAVAAAQRLSTTGATAAPIVAIAIVLLATGGTVLVLARTRHARRD